MQRFYPEGHLFDSPENRAAMRSPRTLDDALSNGQIIEAQAIVCDASHSLTVDLGCMKGIIPRCEGNIGISDGSVRDIALISRVGKAVCFIVKNIEIDKEGNPVAILSRAKAQKLACAYGY